MLNEEISTMMAALRATYGSVNIHQPIHIQHSVTMDTWSFKTPCSCHRHDCYETRPVSWMKTACKTSQLELQLRKKANSPGNVIALPAITVTCFRDARRWLTPCVHNELLRPALLNKSYRSRKLNHKTIVMILRTCENPYFQRWAKKMTTGTIHPYFNGNSGSTFSISEPKQS